MWIPSDISGYPVCASTGVRNCVAALSLHEFGHALGFLHEEARADTPDQCQPEPTEGTGYGEWDVNSVMTNLPCSPFEVATTLSPVDIAGLQHYYEAPTDKPAPNPWAGNRPPSGRFLRAYEVPVGIHISLEASDPDAAEIPVDIYLDNYLVRVTTANGRVEQDLWMDSPGVHRLAAYAIDDAEVSYSTLVDTQVWINPKVPIGALAPTLVDERGAALSGWAIDFSRSSAVTMAVLVDNVHVADWNADAVGLTPEEFHPGFGANHSFSGYIATGPGNHQVCFLGYDDAGDNRMIGCSDFTAGTLCPTEFGDVRCKNGCSTSGGCISDTAVLCSADLGQSMWCETGCSPSGGCN